MEYFDTVVQALKSRILDGRLATAELITLLCDQLGISLVDSTSDFKAVSEKWIEVCVKANKWPEKVLKSGQRKPVGRDQAKKSSNPEIADNGRVCQCLHTSLTRMKSEFKKLEQEQEKAEAEKAEAEKAEAEKAEAENHPLKFARDNANRIALLAVRAMLKDGATMAQQAEFNSLRNDAQKLAYLSK
jgi:hypothetical protein